jgi:HEPN domain-containing protein
MVKMWFEKVAVDLHVAKLVKDLPDAMDSSVFHSQQAAEKAIKGFLTFHQIRFGKTHDIEKLLNLVATLIGLSQTSYNQPRFSQSSL